MSFCCLCFFSSLLSGADVFRVGDYDRRVNWWQNNILWKFLFVKMSAHAYFSIWLELSSTAVSDLAACIISFSFFFGNLYEIIALSPWTEASAATTMSWVGSKCVRSMSGESSDLILWNDSWHSRDEDHSISLVNNVMSGTFSWYNAGRNWTWNIL